MSNHVYCLEIANLFKVTLTWDFRLQVFSRISYSLSIILGQFRTVTKISRDIRKLVLCFSDTGDKLFTSVVVASDNYRLCHWHRWICFVPDFHRFYDTGDSFIRKKTKYLSFEQSIPLYLFLFCFLTYLWRKEHRFIQRG